MNLLNNLISKSELKKFQKSSSSELAVNQKAKLLYRQQSSRKGFPRLINNLQKLDNQKKEVVEINNIPTTLVFNPTRSQSIKSTTFLKNEKLNSCVLCNTPSNQKSFLFLNKRYAILANPGITIPGDLTIPATSHKKQTIYNNFSDMLKISHKLTDYSIYFNGARAGASCPHLHFQAGKEKKLIGEKQIFKALDKPNFNGIDILSISNSDINFYYLNNFLRECYIIRSSQPKFLTEIFQFIMNKLREVNKNFGVESHVPEFGNYISAFDEYEEEARVNLMANYQKSSKKYYVVFFPKRTNRPRSYYSDKHRLLLGMGIKESLGHIITCQESDFKYLKLNPNKIEAAFQDTSITKKQSKTIINSIRSYLS